MAHKMEWGGKWKFWNKPNKKVKEEEYKEFKKGME